MLAAAPAPVPVVPVVVAGAVVDAPCVAEAVAVVLGANSEGADDVAVLGAKSEGPDVAVVAAG